MTNPAQELIKWWAPLKFTTFRMLWIVWLTANTCMWMNDVAASWLMTSLTTSATMIALVQTASNLPVFLLGLPSGALADIFDRRKYFLFTQIWVAVNACVLFITVAFDLLNPSSLLLLTFLNGVGLAMRWPVFAAIVPQLIPKDHLSPALALNGIAMNTSRIIGPILAGAVIAYAGIAEVFALNVIFSIMAAVIIYRWQFQAEVSTLPGERFIGAMRVGWQYIGQSKRIKTVLLRVFFFFMQSSALLALLPLIAKDHFGGDAQTFTLLLACLGFGAVLAASQLPRIRSGWNRTQLANAGSITQAISSIGVIFCPEVWMALPLLIISGMAWICVANSLTISVQLCLPNWVKARGMSFYQVSLMGGSALGAALWGKVTELSTIEAGVISGNLVGLLLLAFIFHKKIEGTIEEDLTPVCPIEHPDTSQQVDMAAGPVMISIHYQIKPENQEEFRSIMTESRKLRLMQGALTWSLFEDHQDSEAFVEYFVFDTWADYLRRFDRFTIQDLKMQEARHALHAGDGPPKIVREIASKLKAKR
ncbi:MAG: MFS transporter [Polynucleobacter sp.]|nr:MAG: MFS transporter [Polynucleobacter sp.]